MTESIFLAWLREHVHKRGAASVPLGDDAAVLAWADRHDCAVTTDLIAEGVHFTIRDAGPRRVGRKALAVNLSDLAAMAARPVAAVVSLLLPRKESIEFAQEIMHGIAALADEFSTEIIGGDTNSWDGPLVLSITAIGETDAHRAPWRRDGARAGDAALVTGQLGGAQAGKHLDFVPRVNEAIALHAQYDVSAAMDLSDGLLLDVSRMADASHCGVEIDLDSIPVSPAARQWANEQGDSALALDNACCGGEDFELLLAVPADEAGRMLAEQPLPVPITRVGTFIDDSGLWSARVAGAPRQRLQPQGYHHQFGS